MPCRQSRLHLVCLMSPTKHRLAFKVGTKQPLSARRMAEHDVFSWAEPDGHTWSRRSLIRTVPQWTTAHSPDITNIYSGQLQGECQWFGHLQSEGQESQGI